MAGFWVKRRLAHAAAVGIGVPDPKVRFADIAGTRFLRRSGIARYDAEEYDYDEVHAPPDTVWEMDPMVSLNLLEAVRAADQRIVAHAHRLIALIARRRSQQKKVLMRSPVGTRASEEGSRDIQSYVNLLASIVFSDGDERSIAGPPLRLSEHEIFSLDDKVFRPARALRFAVFCLLREDIDHDYRLTMVFDEDALRLDPYLLLFHELGCVYAPDLEQLKLPSRIPDHLTSGIFSDDELLDIMSSVALSGFHAQRFDVVEGIATLALEFAQARSVPNFPEKLAPLWCCLIDAHILRGGPTDDAGHGETVSFVRGLRTQYFPDLIGSAAQAQVIQPAMVGRHKAHLRLLAREAELCGLSREDRSSAEELYGELETIEAKLSTVTDQHDPVVLSGRVARRYVRFLLDDPSLLVVSEATATHRGRMLQKAEALLNVNKSRLRRFSGADRVGVMLDIARLRAGEGSLDTAHEYAESAKRRAFSGSVSHGGKLDVFVVLADIKLSLLERNISKEKAARESPKLLKDANVAIRNLRSIAESLGYRPALGVADMLEARALVAEHGLKQPRLQSRAFMPYLPEAMARIARCKKCIEGTGDISFQASLLTIENNAKALLEGTDRDG